ncbi:MAG: hypothetical protein JWM99_3374 [Verrucomicrobiales bacterium]|jgi:hypothetical protein|nr:hypothetical protein [Verrucomicrobiales bacterium]
MEEHFLKDFVVDVTREPSKPWYNAAGDCIIYQITDEAVIADRVDEILTIYRSVENNAAVGYQIKGVKALAEKFGWDGVLIESRNDGEELMEVSLSALLLSAYEQGPKTINRRKAYASAIESGEGRPRMLATDLKLLLGQ